MRTIEDIKKAKDTDELAEMVAQAAEEAGYTLDPNRTYYDEAEHLEESEMDSEYDHYYDLIRILYAAELRWFELEI